MQDRWFNLAISGVRKPLDVWRGSPRSSKGRRGWAANFPKFELQRPHHLGIGIRDHEPQTPRLDKVLHHLLQDMHGRGIHVADGTHFHDHHLHRVAQTLVLLQSTGTLKFAANFELRKTLLIQIWTFRHLNCIIQILSLKTEMNSNGIPSESNS